MKTFEKPMFEVVRFDENDVIVTSIPCMEGPKFDTNICSDGNPSFDDPD